MVQNANFQGVQENMYGLSNHRKSVRSKIIIPLVWTFPKMVHLAINYHGVKCQLPRGTRSHKYVSEHQLSVSRLDILSFHIMEKCYYFHTVKQNEMLVAAKDRIELGNDNDSPN